MPRLSRSWAPVTIRTELTGPSRGAVRDRVLSRVDSISINPKISALLDKPTWSVTSLLPKNAAPSRGQGEITHSQLRHLLRLSALLCPENSTQEQSMLKDLQNHVHFVKEIQKVDTTGVRPLVSLRDDSPQAVWEQEFTKASLAEYIKLEEKHGRNGTIRRRKDTRVEEQYPIRPQERQPESADDEIAWPFKLGGWGSTRRKQSRYFFVQRASEAQKERKGTRPAKSEDAYEAEQVTEEGQQKS